MRKELDGYERLLNDLRARGLMKIHEGKRKLLVSGYEMLGKKLFELKPNVGYRGGWGGCILAWVFLVISWNLTCRPDSTAKLMYQHV